MKKEAQVMQVQHYKYLKMVMKQNTLVMLNFLNLLLLNLKNKKDKK